MAKRRRIKCAKTILITGIYYQVWSSAGLVTLIALPHIKEVETGRTRVSEVQCGIQGSQRFYAVSRGVRGSMRYLGESGILCGK